MNNAIDFEMIRSFYKGAALKKVDAVLPGFKKSIEQGFWEPGVSRAVRAAFYGYGKAATIKLARAIDSDKSLGHDFGYVDVGDFGRVLGSCMPVSVERLEQTLANMKVGKLFFEDRIDISRIPHALMGYFETAICMAKTLEPMWETIKRLDSARPAPVFTMMNASPLISEELKNQNATSVEVPKYGTEWEVIRDAKGSVYQIPVIVIKWPEGTKHGAAKWHRHDGQCECCGHRIKVGGYVPLLLNTEEGPKSLWVGRACAKTLFGVDMKGELTVKE